MDGDREEAKVARVVGSEIAFLPHFPMNGEQVRKKDAEARVGASQVEGDVPEESEEAMKVEEGEGQEKGRYPRAK